VLQAGKDRYERGRGPSLWVAIPLNTARAGARLGRSTRTGPQDQLCSFFGESLWVSSGHSLSTTARISREMASTRSMSEHVLVQPLQIVLQHELAADDARLIDPSPLLHPGWSTSGTTRP
jgi:hypothetical protein